MRQPPGFKRVEERTEFNDRGTDFALVIREPIWLVVRNGVIVFADVGEHTEKPLFFNFRRLRERAFVGGPEQSDEQAAIVFHGAMQERLVSQLVEFAFKISGNTASPQREFQILRVVWGD